MSLRDVERAMIVFEWFYDKSKLIEDELKNQKNYKVSMLYRFLNIFIFISVMQQVDSVVRSLIMAVAVCYHARLQERDDFENSIVNEFLPPFVIPEGRQQFINEIFM